MINLPARFERLTRLSAGFARELLVVRKAQDKLLTTERNAYMNAIGEALRAVETARSILAASLQ